LKGLKQNKYSDARCVVKSEGIQKIARAKRDVKSNTSNSKAIFSQWSFLNGSGYRLRYACGSWNLKTCLMNTPPVI